MTATTTTTTEQDNVNHPSHYGGADNPYEAIKVIEDWNLPFHEGNALKYILRAPHKGREVEDLRKALWYLERATEEARVFERRLEQTPWWRRVLMVFLAKPAETLLQPNISAAAVVFAHKINRDLARVVHALASNDLVDATRCMRHALQKITLVPDSASPGA